MRVKRWSKPYTNMSKDRVYLNLANAQTTKGQRRHRGSIDESARLNNAMFKDAVEPVFSLRRWTSGDEQDKAELNGQKIFFTTSGFRGTEEFIRTINFANDMADCKGAYVFGANWELPVHFGLLTRKYVMDIKNDETTSPIAFLQNYESVWVGAGQDALINMDKVNNLRNPELKPMLKGNGLDEYIIAMDVARSQTQSNNQSAFIVGRIERNKNGTVRYVDIVNIVTPKNGLTFREQTIILKRLQKQYNAKMCVVDINGLGRAIPDEVIHETVDIETGEVYDSWGIVNMDIKPDVPNAKQLLFGINATGINNEIIINFWDYIESGKVRFLVSERNAKYSSKLSEEERIKYTQIYMQTDKLMEELSNLKVEKAGNSNKFTVKQVTRKIDKDRYSALVYLLYYIQNYENVNRRNNTDLLDCFFYN